VKLKISCCRYATLGLKSVLMEREKSKKQPVNEGSDARYNGTMSSKSLETKIDYHLLSLLS